MGAGLLEREREVEVLAAAIERAAAGTAGVLLIEGAAGIGKTQIVTEARRLAAEAGVRVFAARGGELEREFPFGVVRQLYEPALANSAGKRLLSGAAAPARTVFETLEEPSDPAGDASFAVLHGLYWLTVNLAADGPLLLVVDDLHWCDRPSLRFLAYLARRLEGLPVLAIASLRPAEPGVDAALLGDIVGDPLTSSVHPRPLSESGVAELVRARLGDGAEDAFAAACHAATGGNPLLLNELLKALATEGVEPTAANRERVAELGPRAASRAVLLRLGRLSPEAVAVGRATAVLGEGADRSVLAALAGLDEPQAARAAAALSRAEILRAEPPLGFVHPLVRDAVYQDVPAGERELMHERAARLLAEAHAPAEQVAAQLLATPSRGDDWVVDRLAEAAREALKKGAADSAVAYLSRGLEEPASPERRPELLLELGHAEVLTSGPAAARHLREAYDALGDPVVRGQTARLLGLALLQTGFREEAAEVTREAAAALPPEQSDLRGALEAFEFGIGLFGVGARETFELARYRKAPVDSPGSMMLAGMEALYWTYADGPAEQCARMALDAFGGGKILDWDNGFLSIAPQMVLAFADREEVLDAWEASLEDAHRRGSLYAISSVHLWHGFNMILRGELAEAEEELAEAWQEFELWGFGSLANVYCSGFLAWVKLERGDLEGARRALDQSSDPGFTADGVRYWLNTKVAVEVAEGRLDEALATAAQLERDYGWVANPAVGGWRASQAEALDRLDRRDEALEVAAEELRRAREWGGPRSVGRALRVLGTIWRQQGIELLEEAVQVLEHSPARLELAKALAALGVALRHARRPADAREPLRRSLELAEVCGASGLVEHVRSELYATGVRPRTTAFSGLDALTASERRVAALAADGQTNRDIAQTLFVTPKTVEVHLSNVYRKLAIRSRRELPSALAAA
jgi:DNA-binding CsgD family transcriptional regulator/tetratricopeptide (TPR) repeat protein